jgi:hypothetical protein
MRVQNLFSLGVLLLVAVGCSSEPDPNDPSQFQGQGQYGQGQGQYPPGQYPPGTATAPATQTAPPATATGQAGSTATPIAPAAAAIATPALTALASAETRGMSPEGGAFAGNFQQGQTLEQPFNIEPGKCYTVVGVGVGITELDIQIVGQLGPMTQVLAQDNQTGAQAVVGSAGNCFKNPLPVGGPAKVVMKATGGTGIAVAQIYKK